MIHEMSHWTGGEARLNRDLRNRFGSHEYSREELRALSTRDECVSPGG